MTVDKLLAALTQIVAEYGGKVVVALIVLFVGWSAAGWVGNLARKALGRTKVDATLAAFLARLVRWSIMLLVILACLSIFGVETTSFAAVIGSAGIAIGLAIQGTLSNCAAGVMLLMFRPFNVGDAVVIGGQMGTVNEIELFTTTIDSFDNRRFIIPNSHIFGSTIENMTYHSRRRADIDVGVAYSADIDRTREVLTQAAANVPGGLSDPAPEIFLQKLGGSSVDWTVRVWANTAEFGAVKQAVVRAVKMALDDACIEIPFPQMDVHLTKEE